MVHHYDQDGFYKLPDWKKLTLKRSKPKYRGYRVMTYEQEARRREAILSICAHFGRTTEEEFEEDVFETMRHFWPQKIEYYLTPRLLDLCSVEFLTQFGYCTYCMSYDGVKKRKLQGNVIPFKGFCTKSEDEFDIEIVSQDGRCCAWEPTNLHVQLMYHKISKVLRAVNNYSEKEYIADLQKFNFWNYFFYIN